MTPRQKHIVKVLFEGGNVVANRLRDKDHNPVVKIHPRTGWWIRRNLMRREKSGLFVIDKRKVRQMHGNCWIKREYKKRLKTKV